MSGADFITLKDFGPCGNGNQQEDTTTFIAALAHLQTGRRAVTAPGGGQVYPGPSIFIPPGDYLVDGGFGAALERVSLVAAQNSVTIRVMKDEYFLDLPNRLDAAEITGITFLGGKGALRHTYRGNNVANRLIVRECDFLDYTECAVSTDALDIPFIRVIDNRFRCHGAAEFAKGLAIGGLNDNAIISLNAFDQNDIHLQIGPNTSGSVNIVFNDFISLQAGRTKYDVWLIPSDQDLGYINSGANTTFENNKFGNEQLTTSYPRVLIAAAIPNPQSTDPEPRSIARPDLTWKTGADKIHVSGLRFRDNRFSNAWVVPSLKGVAAPLIALHVEKVADLVWEPSNTIQGGSYTYLFEHVDGGARVARADNTNWTVDLSNFNTAPFRSGVTNRPIGLIRDPNGISGSRYAASGAVNSPLATTLASVVAHTDWTLHGNPGMAATTNVDGAADGTEYTGVQGSYLSKHIFFTTKDCPGWIVGSVKIPSGQTNSRVTFIIDGWNGTFSRNMLAVDLPVAADGQYHPVCIPFTIPADLVDGALITGCTDTTGIIHYGDFKIGAGPLPPPL